jgi:hypothetical protein
LTHKCRHAAIALQHESAGGTRQAVSSVMESEMEERVEKLEYETPNLTVHGSIETITQAAGFGDTLDADFPRNTPNSDLTFS